MMNAAGEKDIFEFVEGQGYLNAISGEKYTPPSRGSSDLKFLVFGDATDKTTNVLQTKNDDESDTKPPISVKKQVVGGEEKLKLPLTTSCLRKYSCNSKTCACAILQTTGTFGCVRGGTPTEECKNNDPRHVHAHYGLDLTASDDTPCFAIANGAIVKSGWSDTYGYYTLLKCLLNGKTRYVYYAHLNEILIGSGNVKKGDKIGLTGHTGSVASNMCPAEKHLHFEIRLDDTIGFRKFAQNEDPNLYLKINCYN